MANNKKKKKPDKIAEIVGKRQKIVGKKGIKKTK